VLKLSLISCSSVRSFEEAVSVEAKFRLVVLLFVHLRRQSVLKLSLDWSFFCSFI